MPTFTPPAVVDVGPVPRQPRPDDDPLGVRLMAHYAPMPRYQWVLRIGGVYATYDHPTVDQVNAASERYSGPSVVSDATAALLEAAGYDVG